jgi:antitoxin YefM
MIAINYTTMRNKLKNTLDKVTDDCETVIVTRKEEKNVVIISLEQYNNFIENDFIFSNKKYYNRLLESKKQIEQGKTVLKTTEEMEKIFDE